MARSRSETLIAAVAAFHQRHQRYPDTLDELVPGCLDRVPVAKYTPFGSCRYTSLPTSHSLFYVDVPPFGRRIYRFARARGEAET